MRFGPGDAGQEGTIVNFDLRYVPFSRCGSYFAFSRMNRTDQRPAGLYLRTVHGDARVQEVFRIELIGPGGRRAFTESATAGRLRLEAGDAVAEVCIRSPGAVRFRVRNASLRLTALPARQFQAYAFPAGERQWRVNSFPTRREYMLTAMTGEMAVASPWPAGPPLTVRLSAPATAPAEMLLEEFLCARPTALPTASFDADVRAVEDDFARFRAGMPAVPAKYAAPAELAAYVDWSCIVAAEGLLPTPAMLMSKNWMTSVWSWDHCFNALALAYGHSDLAWDQFMLFADSQDPSGQFCDAINDRLTVWNFCKPPVHGWTLRKLLAAGPSLRRRVREAYEPLRRWTEWWLACRDDDGDGMPQYNHGNDSGWDNATVFDVGPNVEGPDLAALLVVQMDVLAEVADGLGKPRQGRQWRKRADELLATLLSHCWRGDRFVAPRSGDHAVAAEGDCLLPYLPIVLGQRLPPGIRARLIDGLLRKGRFLTRFGLASESPRSPLYQRAGYWRGPIWAPPVLLICDGLTECGQAPAARDLAERFCRLCAAGGFAENFDATTGRPLCDRAYTWTASIFLILAHEYLTKPPATARRHSSGGIVSDTVHWP